VRRRAALAFGTAGLLAGVFHVIAETDGALRDWRQTVPLAAVVGAALGAAFPPRGQAAVHGALLAAAGFVGFAVLFALGHELISGGGWGALWRALGVAAGPTGLAAVALGAAAGWLARR
jgi:hypothetical protein